MQAVIGPVETKIAPRTLLLELVSECVGKMVPELVQVVNLKGLVIQKLVIDTTFE